MQECQCEEEKLQCHVCCKKAGTTCTAAKDIPDIGKELEHHPGAACDNYEGYCDVFLKCRKVQ